MIEEDDNNWDDTGFSKIELEDILNEYSDIYVSNNPYEKIRKRKAYLIEGLIAHGSINIFYGDPKVGKSMLLVDLASSLISGGNWANLNTKNCLTLYLAFEDPEGIDDRLTLSSIKKGFVKEGIVQNLWAYHPPPDIFSKKFLAALQLNMFEHGRFYDHSIIVIDTLSFAMARLGDENSSVTMGIVIDTCRKIRDLGYTIFIIHHTGKDKRKGLRGHKSLQAAADSIFLVKKILRSSTVNVERIECRNGPGGEKFNFEIKTATLHGNSSEQIPYLEFKDYGEAPTPADKVTPREFKVLKITEELLKTHPVNIKSVFGLQTDLLAIQLCQIEEVFIAKAIAPQAKSKASQRKAIKRVLDSLVQKEMVHQQDGFYWLPDPDQTGSDIAEQ